MVWTDRYKYNWDDAYKRIMAWWRNEETDRPVFFNPVKKPESELKGSLIIPKTAEEAGKFDLDIDIRINNIRYKIENYVYPAEAVPSAMSNYGNLLGMLCSLAGGRIEYSIEDDTTWLTGNPELLDQGVPDTDAACEALNFVLELIKRCHKEFGFDIVLGANPMLDPLTTLSMMRGVENFLMDLYDRPDDVKRWAKRMGGLHRRAIEAWRKARAALGRREDFLWCNAWAPGDMDAIQCDVSTMMSPDMFREFALPEAEYEVSFYDYVLWHLDGTAEFKHLDDLLSIPGLNGFQYIDEKKSDPLQYCDIWKKILKKRKSIVFCCESCYIPALVRELGPRGLAFSPLDSLSLGDIEKLIQ
jgi:hypothetical protein